ncbi:hypothetical protein UMM65_13175 [Aureibaculum sp. 2210JD6-5]|uniref:hypothetical protein n=1 Tax=Aureibaculum sp. 2210JD6-5 TaxID=3103957 RepID=UPI002AACE78F|nr:hypothetical protein [Aureibaculum sp. 2210JD6-5]MDY7396197.1 hypothetical protein [Aureibaculum sp. 2210JD6-5]
MKYVLILIVFISSQINAQPVISDNGHPEHVIAGAIIGGGVSYLVYRKTNNKFKAWLIGAASAATIGYLKEAVDPKWFNGVRSKKDFQYSVLGGAIGASIVIPLKRRKPKKTPNIDAAFRQQVSDEKLNQFNATN